MTQLNTITAWPTKEQLIEIKAVSKLETQYRY